MQRRFYRKDAALTPTQFFHYFQFFPFFPRTFNNKTILYFLKKVILLWAKIYKKYIQFLKKKF